MPDIIKMPKLGFDMAEGTLIQWVRAEGEEIKKGDVLAEIETDKATVEVESSFSGLVNRHLVEQGAIVPVGTPIAVIAQPGEEVTDLPEIETAEGEAPEETVEAVAPSVSAPVETPAATGRIKASPLAKRLAKEQGIDLKKIKGTGTGGRIVRKDVEAVIAAAPAPATPAVPLPAAAAPTEKKAAVLPPLPAFAPAEAPPDEVIPVNRLRAAIGRRLAEAKQQVPHFYVTHEYDFSPVMAMRKEVNKLLPPEEKTSVNDYIVKAVALALRQYPNMNASINGDEIVRHGHINVGVAVAVEGGLLTIVSQDTDMKPIRVISAEIKHMAQRARVGKVRPDDIEGSTFSISNLGMFDVENFAAIINPPEAAILAISSVKQVPVVVDGEVTIGLRMKATLSADHRVTDGAEAAKFLQAIEAYFKEPMRLVL